MSGDVWELFLARFEAVVLTALKALCPLCVHESARDSHLVCLSEHG